jgi:hypothetical protein
VALALRGINDDTHPSLRTFVPDVHTTTQRRYVVDHPKGQIRWVA